MINVKTLIFAALASVVLSGAAMAGADGDPAKGKKVAAKCKACHSLDKEKNKVGPHLVGIFGRSIASIDGYKYSKGANSLTAFAEGGKVWDEAVLAEFLKKPKALVKKTKMGFRGLKKEQQVEDLIAYLKTL